MAKDGEGTPLLQPFLRRHLYEVADAVIEAEFELLKNLYVIYDRTLQIASHNVSSFPQDDNDDAPAYLQ